jgi:hypothetical protein
MAIDLAMIRDRVRDELHDTDPNHGYLDQVRYDQRIADAYLELRAFLPDPKVNTETAFTIAAGGDTFTLPATVTQYTGNDGGAEYSGQTEVRLRSNGRFLLRRSQRELDAFRSGKATVHLGIPRLYALWEEKDQGVNGRCYPGAKVAEACDLFHTLAADDLRDYVGTGTNTLDDVEVLMSRYAARGLVLFVASDVLARMPESEAVIRKLDKSAASDWRKRAMQMLMEETARQHNIKSTGRTQRWVS